MIDPLYPTDFLSILQYLVTKYVDLIICAP